MTSAGRGLAHAPLDRRPGERWRPRRVFPLAWAAETAEADVPRSFAVAVLAVLAVVPEHAADALSPFTAGSEAGTDRRVEAGNLAIANMTGANRILIGLGWAAIELFTLWRARRVVDRSAIERDEVLANAVTLHRGIAVEIGFLGTASLWAFLVPLGGGSARSIRSYSSASTRFTSSSSSGPAPRRSTCTSAFRRTCRRVAAASGFRR